MRVFGWICVVLGALNLLIGIGISGSYPEQAGSKLGGGVMILVLGIFLLYRANKKEEEQKDKEKWEKGD